MLYSIIRSSRFGSFKLFAVAVMVAATIVFDLDGTLVDTAPDLIATLNLILSREDLPAVPLDTARPMIGGGARFLIERGLAAAGRSMTREEVDRLVHDFIAYYAEHIADHSRPFPGTEAALDMLAAQGCRLTVCTNKLEWLSVRLLQTLGLGWRFAAICGADTFGVSKPNPVILHKTIIQAGGDPDRAVMVGDSRTDILTARAAGVPVVAVDFGYTETPVSELNPDRVINHFEKLPAALSELIGTLDDA
jgi:phosphoglycolate phosphatase